MNNLIKKLEKITLWPKKPKDKQIVIRWLSEKFEFEKQYSEKEVNRIIQQYHSFDDIPLLRRELISRSFLNRKNDGSLYWKNK